MRLLLDTHALLWWLADDPTLSEGAISAVAEARNSVYVSAVSAWEIAIKRSLGDWSFCFTHHADCLA